MPWCAQTSRPASAHAWRCCGQLSRTPSATAGPSCEQMPRPDASGHALRTSRLHHRHLLWAPGSHIIGTGRAMVLAAGCMKKVSPFQTLDATFGCLAHHRQQLRHGPPDALTSLRTCLAPLQAAVSHTIGSNWAMVRQDVSTSLDLVRRTASGHASTWAGNWLGHHRHQQGLGACGWLYEKSVPISDTRCYGHLPRTPSAVTLTWSARIPRTASAHALRCYRRLARTPSAATATWCEQMPRPASTWCAELRRGMPG